MKFKILFVFIVLSINIFSQKIIEEYKPPEGYLRIGSEPDQMIPMVEKGFTLILPEGEVNGVIVVLTGERFDFKEAVSKNGSLENEALKKNIAIIHILSGNPLDFYFTSDIMTDVAKKLQSVLADNNLKGKPVYFSGMSLAGTRALKLAIFLQMNKEKFWMQPAAVAITDAPLDMVRFWDVENRAVINKFHPDVTDEGKWVTYLLKENLGTPEENFNNYVDYSPFVYVAEDGGNAEHLRNIPVRAYYETDVNWFIENRRQDYYSMNSIDMAALINQLKLLDNENAELISTHQKHNGFNEGSSLHTDIPQGGIDYAELMDWFLSFQY
ncbi:MAG: hypothetical protein Q7S39_10295 [Ignavibacteria bacterium]|nr:hypothetical protein [Ignavibacteria bacterium]